MGANKRKREYQFFLQGVKDMRRTGALFRSSSHLCQKIVKKIDFDTDLTLVEIGAGDGAITRKILNRMSLDSRLLVIELNPAFCQIIRDFNDHRVTVYEGSAEDIEEIVRAQQLGRVDYIVSGLPFVMMRKKLRNNIIKACLRVLEPGKKFLQFHYSPRLHLWYEKYFNKVKLDFAILNLPPALIYVCEK